MGVFTISMVENQSTNQVNKALFPLSGDPITNGHLNIIERASKWVKEIVVVVLKNDSKPSILTLKERVEIVELCLKSRGLKNISVDAYNGLLSDYATRTGILHIIRGIRNANDLEYEIFLESGHKRQNPKLEIIYFLSDSQHRTTSSSIARAILNRGGQIKDYVPLQAKQAMEERLMGQHKLIVTGGIACGKSYITEKLAASLTQDGYQTQNIDFDALVRHIYQGLAKGEYFSLAREMVDYLGQSILDGKYISQKKVSQEVFSPSDHQNQKINSEEKLQVLLNLLRPYINSLYHEELATQRGLIFLNIPLAGESQILYESNNNVLLVTSNLEMQEKRLAEKRGISKKEARLRIERAGTSEVKKKFIKAILNREKVGKLIIFENDQDDDSNQERIEELKEKILKLFPILKSGTKE